MLWLNVGIVEYMPYQLTNKYLSVIEGGNSSKTTSKKSKKNRK